MNKKVNIYPKNPILGINPPIRSATRKVTKSTDEIRICIIARAIVEEILPDGSTIKLNFTNYNKDNTSCMKPKPRKAIVLNTESKPELKEPVKDKTVVEETIEEPVITEIVTNEEQSVSVKDKTVVEETIEEPVITAIETVTNEEQSTPAKLTNETANHKKKFDVKKKFGDNRYQPNRNMATTSSTESTKDETPVETKDAESLITK